MKRNRDNDHDPDGFHRRRQRNETLSALLDMVGDGLGCILVLLLAALAIYGWFAGS